MDGYLGAVIGFMLGLIVGTIVCWYAFRHHGFIG